MNKLLIAVVGALSFVSAIPAVAGPDMQIIENGRKAKQEQMRGETQMQGMSDHSHAQASPEMHAKHEKMMKACTEMMKKSVQ